MLVLIGLSILFKFSFFNIFIAALIIWLGVKILSGSNRSIGVGVENVMDEDSINRVLIFSGYKTKITSSNFKGGEVVTVFGGAEIDLSKASSKEKDIYLDITAVFGGAKLTVPKNWLIKSEGSAVFGGYDNNTEHSSKPTNILHLKGAAIFGGVEIVN